MYLMARSCACVHSSLYYCDGISTYNIEFVYATTVHYILLWVNQRVKLILLKLSGANQFVQGNVVAKVFLTVQVLWVPLNTVFQFKLYEAFPEFVRIRAVQYKSLRGKHHGKSLMQKLFRANVCHANHSSSFSIRIQWLLLVK